MYQQPQQHMQQQQMQQQQQQQQQYQQQQQQLQQQQQQQYQWDLQQAQMLGPGWVPQYPNGQLCFYNEHTGESRYADGSQQGGGCSGGYGQQGAYGYGQQQQQQYGQQPMWGGQQHGWYG